MWPFSSTPTENYCRHGETDRSCHICRNTQGSIFWRRAIPFCRCTREPSPIATCDKCKERFRQECAAGFGGGDGRGSLDDLVTLIDKVCAEAPIRHGDPFESMVGYECRCGLSYPLCNCKWIDWPATDKIRKAQKPIFTFKREAIMNTKPMPVEYTVKHHDDKPCEREIVIPEGVGVVQL